MPPQFRPVRRRLLLAVAGAVTVPSGDSKAWPFRSGLPDPADPRTTMQDVEAAVTRLLPVPEITPVELAKRIETGARLVLLDVREAAEYAQSRIPGAIRVQPGTPAPAVIARHGAAMEGAMVVFYCAVGWRSGLKVQGIRQAAAQVPADALFNLRGGIFRWYAEGRALAFGPDASGVHPFSKSWGQLLRRLVQA